MSVPARSTASFVFDLDNTLYPASATVYDAIGARMTAFIARELGLRDDAALQLRERYFHMYGATVVGLVRHHGLGAQAFLDDVHDVPLSDVAPDEALAALIERLPGRKFVFTNGARAYALRVLDRLGLAGAFDDLCAIEDLDLVPKPQPESFRRMQERFDLAPETTLFADDHLLNVRSAAALGFRAVLIGHPEPPADVEAAPDVASLLRDLFDRELNGAPPRATCA